MSGGQVSKRAQVPASALACMAPACAAAACAAAGTAGGAWRQAPRWRRSPRPAGAGLPPPLASARATHTAAQTTAHAHTTMLPAMHTRAPGALTVVHAALGVVGVAGAEVLHGVGRILHGGGGRPGRARRQAGGRRGQRVLHAHKLPARWAAGRADGWVDGWMGGWAHAPPWPPAPQPACLPLEPARGRLLLWGGPARPSSAATRQDLLVAGLHGGPGRPQHRLGPLGVGNHHVACSAAQRARRSGDAPAWGRPASAAPPGAAHAPTAPPVSGDTLSGRGRLQQAPCQPSSPGRAPMNQPASQPAQPTHRCRCPETPSRAPPCRRHPPGRGR